MKQYLHIIYMMAIMSSFLFLQSCLDEIELGVPKGQSDAVVVQGKLIVGDVTEISVLVNRLFTFDGTSTTLRVKTVELICENGDTQEVDFISEGVYQKIIPENSNFMIKAGVGYKINIELFDGRMIASNFEELIAFESQNEAVISVKEKPIYNQEVNDVLNVDRLVLDVKSEFNNDQNNPQRFRWTVDATYRITDNPSLFGVDKARQTCYATYAFRNIQEQKLYDGFDANIGSQIYEAEVFSGRLDESIYFDTVYLHVRQESLTESAYDYFFRIGETLKLAGTMFDPAAGTITSNLVNVNEPDEQVFGYFYASIQSKTTVMFTPDFIGNPVRKLDCTSQEQLESISGICKIEECCDCVTALRASTTKPDYWN